MGRTFATYLPSQQTLTQRMTALEVRHGGQLGYDHVDSPSSLQGTDLHITQRKFDDQGRAN
jgi:hypothetical protein